MRRVRMEAAAEAAVVASVGTEAVAVEVAVAVAVAVEVEVGGVQSRVMHIVMKPSWHVRNCRVLVQ